MRGEAHAAILSAKVESQASAASRQSAATDRERRRRADLLSVDCRGARPRVPARERFRVWREGRALMLTLCSACARGIVEKVSCLARWVQGDDLGVDFSRPLPVRVSVLQGRPER